MRLLLHINIQINNQIKIKIEKPKATAEVQENRQQFITQQNECKITMKKNYINLRHPQHGLSANIPNNNGGLNFNLRLDLTGKGTQSVVLNQLPQSAIPILLNYLRLSQIIQLYYSASQSHKCQDFSRGLMNYLMATERVYSADEEREFVQVIVKSQLEIGRQERMATLIDRNNEHQRISMDNIYKQNQKHQQYEYLYNDQESQQNNILIPNCCTYVNSTPSSYNVNISNKNNKSRLKNNKKQANFEMLNNNYTYPNQIVILPQIPKATNLVAGNDPINSNMGSNDTSRINRHKQTIANDVDRTYINKNHYHYQYYSTNYSQGNKNISKNKSKMNRQKNMTQQEHRQVQQKQSQTLSTEYPSNANLHIVASQQYSYPYTQINLQLDRQPQLVPKQSQSQMLSSNPSSYFEPVFPLCQALTPTNLGNPATMVGYEPQMHKSLNKILLTLSTMYPKLGYIQGLNHIGKALYLSSLSHSQCLTYLSYFLQNRQLQQILTNGMWGLKQLSYVFKVYLYNYVPRVYKIVVGSRTGQNGDDDMGVGLQGITIRWFVTILSEELPIWVVNRLWHLFVIGGWAIIVRFCVAVVCVYQDDILRHSDSDQALRVIRGIIGKFGQQCVSAYRNNPNNMINPNIKNIKTPKSRIWPSSSYGSLNSPSKHETVWKLMTSIEVSNSIVSQLCREMTNLQYDSEIQIWRIQMPLKSARGSSNIKNGKAAGQRERAYSQKSLTQNERNSHNQNRGGLRGNNYNYNINMGSQLCCDRINYVQGVNIYKTSLNSNTNNHSNSESAGMFSLCHNVGPYIH